MEKDTCKPFQFSLLKGFSFMVYVSVLLGALMKIWGDSPENGWSFLSVFISFTTVLTGFVLALFATSKALCDWMD